jgi:uncharacterized membrane-anchored protein
MVAAGAGDAALALRAARAAEKHLGEDALTLLLRAQAGALQQLRAQVCCAAIHTHTHTHTHTHKP